MKLLLTTHLLAISSILSPDLRAAQGKAHLESNDKIVIRNFDTRGSVTIALEGSYNCRWDEHNIQVRMFQPTNIIDQYIFFATNGTYSYSATKMVNRDRRDFDVIAKEDSFGEIEASKMPSTKFHAWGPLESRIYLWHLRNALARGADLTLLNEVIPSIILTRAREDDIQHIYSEINASTTSNILVNFWASSKLEGKEILKSDDRLLIAQIEAFFDEQSLIKNSSFTVYVKTRDRGEGKLKTVPLARVDFTLLSSHNLEENEPIFNAVSYSNNDVVRVIDRRYSGEEKLRYKLTKGDDIPFNLNETDSNIALNQKALNKKKNDNKQTIRTAAIASIGIIIFMAIITIGLSRTIENTTKK